MKTLFSLRKLSLLIVLSISSILFLASCSKDSNDDDNGDTQVYTTQGDATGSQQNPMVVTSGSARLVGTYDASNNNWEYSISWSSLTGTATLIEFHGPADLGVNGALIFSVDIAAGGSNGAISATKTLSEQQEAYLRSGQIYFTIISTAHLTGEVRGQVYTLVR